ncbi:hypothetical protein DKX38_017889 [Salix brachista]|uniref:Pollen Ole e 1 allergen and extensin family protein n=1 Tax=Salix brachista TaxID=2182728 RepID=A0A5N5KWF3_9ROSI|nr:hypothetical protein DKX38_017889 [Salix brachista]
MDSQLRKLVTGLFLLSAISVSGVKAWTGEIHGRVVCDVCGDSSIGPEDHVLEDGLEIYCCIAVITSYFAVSLCISYIISVVMVWPGAEVAVLCITKSGEVLNYQAFTNDKGVYTVAETMSESDRWDACLARPISSFHEHCTQLGETSTGVKFSYDRPSGFSQSQTFSTQRNQNENNYCY